MRRYKRIIALILAAAISVSACSNTGASEDNAYLQAADSVTPGTVSDIQESEKPEETQINTSAETEVDSFEGEEIEVETPEFYGINDPAFLSYIEKSVEEGLSDQNDYVVKEVQTSYISYEYLEEAEYNSRKNIYFGYTLEEIEEQFQEEKFVFTLGDDGTTVVKPFEEYDDTFERIIRNFAVGTGVVLIKISVEYLKTSISGGALGVGEIIFAVASETYHELIDELRGEGTIIKIIKVAAERWDETNDWEEALKAAVLQLSEDYKCAAIKGLCR